MQNDDHSARYSATITELPGSQVEIKGEIYWDELKRHERPAFARIAQHLEVPGFRKGHVPESVAKEHIQDETVLLDMAELALQEIYPLLIKEKSLDVIGRPQIAITKIARDNSLGFTLTTAVLPNIALPDYKKIAHNMEKVAAAEVTEQDVDKVIEDLRQMRAYGHVHSKEELESHAHDEPLPEVDDAFAQSFGNFKTVAELRDKVRENLGRENAQEAKDKRRIAIMDTIISDTAFEVPDLVLKSEQEKMLAQIESEVARAGMSFDDYLTHTQKTRDALMEEFKPEAERRSRFQLVINAIARAEQVTIPEAEIKAEAERLMATYPGADQVRTEGYADMVLTNEKVLVMLESQ